MTYRFLIEFMRIKEYECLLRLTIKKINQIFNIIRRCLRINDFHTTCFCKYFRNRF